MSCRRDSTWRTRRRAIRPNRDPDRAVSQRRRVPPSRDSAEASSFPRHQWRPRSPPSGFEQVPLSCCFSGRISRINPINSKTLLSCPAPGNLTRRPRRGYSLINNRKRMRGFVCGRLLSRERPDRRGLVKPDPLVKLVGERGVEIMAQSLRFRMINHANRSF